MDNIYTLSLEPLADPYETLKEAYETGTDPFAWLAAHGIQRHGALIRAARNLRRWQRAQKAAYEREQRARAAELRRARIDALGRLRTIAGATLSEREYDAIRAHLDVKGRLTPAHMERAGYGVVEGEWVGSLDVWGQGTKAY